MPDTQEQFMEPILRELGDDLAAAFVAEETRSRTAVVTARRRKRWLVPASGLAAAVAVLAVTLGLDGGRVTPETASAADALRRAATTAENRPALFPRDDQYFYVHSTSTYLNTLASTADRSAGPPPGGPTGPRSDGALALVTQERSIWLSIQRPGRLKHRVTNTRYPTASDRRAWQRAGEAPATNGPIPIDPVKHYRLGSIELTRQQMIDFPTDPKVIYNRLRAEVSGGNSPEGEVYTEIGDALRESPAPADLRAGLYRALALVPNVELVGRVTDSAGRTGTAVAFTEAGVRRELVFDPETSEMLAERDVLIAPDKAGIDLPAGTVIGDSVYLARAVTDEPSER